MASSKVINSGAGEVTLTSAANAVDILSWHYDGTDILWKIGLNYTSDAVVNDWVTRVVANGGAMPSSTTINALQVFVAKLRSVGLWSKMLIINPLVSDNLIASITPLLKGNSSDPWANSGFVLGDLTANGLTGNGNGSGSGSKRLQIGTNGSIFTGYTPNNFGFTLYFKTLIQGGQFELGCYDGSLFLGGRFRFNDTTCKAAICDNNNYVGTTYPGSPGYFSTNRISATDLRMFWANSTNAHQQFSTTVTVSNSFGFPSANLQLFSLDTSSGFTNATISFSAFHQALTAAESANFFNAVQALRTALGGGFV